MTKEQLETVQKLRELGATRVEVKPDGAIVAEFGKEVAVPVHVPVPAPYYVPHYPWPYQPLGPWWGAEPVTTTPAPLTPTITWSVSGGDLPQRR